MLEKIATTLEVSPIEIMQKDLLIAGNFNNTSGDTDFVNNWINAEVFISYNKELVKKLFEAKENEISTLRKTVDILQNLLTHSTKGI